jgi:hypothetical protein
MAFLGVSVPLLRDCERATLSLHIQPSCSMSIAAPNPEQVKSIASEVSPVHSSSEGQVRSARDTRSLYRGAVRDDNNQSQCPLRW